MKILILLIIVVLFCFSVVFRVLVLHPFKTAYYMAVDLFQFFRFRKWRNMDFGYIICFVGLFGKGKTLASVYYVLEKYKKYNNKRVYDRDRKKWVTQVVKILSNVDLNVPYIKFTSLQQIVDISKTQRDYDYENDLLTMTLVLGDEFSVQLNSRNFKKNIDPLFLNTLLTCRHHHISIIYNAQRFGHVDALLRQVTSYVIDSDKLWRIMVHRKYDAWDMENASSPSMCKPLRSYGWFIANKDFEAYDTLACVDNLTKSCEEGDLLSEAEILQLQSNSMDSDNESVNRSSRKLRKRFKGKF